MEQEILTGVGHKKEGAGFRVQGASNYELRIINYE
jgi:hypothetical protein